MSSVRIGILITALFALLVVLSAYFHRKCVAVFRLRTRGKRLLGVVLVAALGSVAMSRIAAAGGSGGVPGFLVLCAYTVELTVLAAALLLGATDALASVLRLLAMIVKHDAASTPAMPAPTVPGALGGPSRRAFLTQAAVGSTVALGGSGSVYGVLFGRHDYHVEEVTIPISGLSRALEGFTIVQLSDLHFGFFVGDPETRAAEELVRRAHPDLVVLTGDLVDHDLRFVGKLGALVRRLGPLARAGLVAIPGNHDYYAGVDATLAAVQQAGGRVLRNAGMTVGGPGGAFALLGVDDVFASHVAAGAGPDLRRAIGDVPPDLPRVLLCHNPILFPNAAEQVALQLSGHTHGGQLNPGVRPADWMLPYGYVAGLYERKGSRLYVNRGFGTAGPPARIGAPPEVTRIVLVSA